MAMSLWPHFLAHPVCRWGVGLPVGHRLGYRRAHLIAVYLFIYLHILLVGHSNAVAINDDINTPTCFPLRGNLTTYACFRVMCLNVGSYACVACLRNGRASVRPSVLRSVCPIIRQQQRTRRLCCRSGHILTV